MIAAPLCLLSDIPDPGAKGFAVTHGGQRVKVFVVRRDGEVFGYVDSCPHLGSISTRATSCAPTTPPDSTSTAACASGDPAPGARWSPIRS